MEVYSAALRRAGISCILIVVFVMVMFISLHATTPGKRGFGLSFPFFPVFRYHLRWNRGYRSVSFCVGQDSPLVCKHLCGILRIIALIFSKGVNLYSINLAPDTPQFINAFLGELKLALSQIPITCTMERAYCILSHE